MVKITANVDCENSPKNNFIKDFNIAFAQEDNPKILEMVAEDVEWQVVGHSTIAGKAAFQKALEGIQGGQVKELILEKVLSHGNLGAASGQIHMTNGAIYAFSDTYEFANNEGTHLRVIQSFNIDVTKQKKG